jgi:antitoxin component of MazEF toxin-antitoxin module
MTKTFKSKIIKDGDHFVVLLPQEVLKHLDVKEGDDVNVSREVIDCITVRKSEMTDY